MGFKVAIAGATGSVGREMLSILQEREFPVDEIILLASSRSHGKKMTYKDRDILVQSLEKYDFSGTDICLMSSGGDISKQFSPKIASHNCIVIDNSSSWRYNENVPLIIPEVNPDAIINFDKLNIIANPNCSTIQLLVVLKPLHDAAIIDRVVVSTYQSVSGAGKKGIDELFEQSRAKFFENPILIKNFTKRIAFNIIPHIDQFMKDGYTKEEWKILSETRKILDPKIKLTATAVRVPVFIGHGESVNIEFQKPISENSVRKILSKSPGVSVYDKQENGGYITPQDVEGKNLTYVSRIRNDNTVKNGISLWIVSDNLRKGAALNAIQIAELLISKNLIKKK